MKLNHTLRIAIPQFGAFIVRTEEGDIASVAWKPYLELLLPWFTNNFQGYQLVWTPKGDATNGGFKGPDGNFTGLLGLFQRNTSDICIIEQPGFPEQEEVCDTGPVLRAAHSEVTSVLEHDRVDHSILYRIFNLTNQVSILVIVSILLLAFLLWKLENTFQSRKKVKLLDSLWYMIEYFLQQDTYNPMTRVAQLMVLTIMIGNFFYYSMWTNIMTTEIVSIDTSKNIRSLDDILRLNYSVLMMNVDPIVQQLEWVSQAQPESILSKVHQRTQIMTLVDATVGNQEGIINSLCPQLKIWYKKYVESKFSINDLKGFAFMFNDEWTKMMITSSCGFFSSSRMLTTREGGLEYQLFAWRSKFMAPDVRTQLDRMTVILRESGVLLFLDDEKVKSVTGMIGSSIGSAKMDYCIVNFNKWVMQQIMTPPKEISLKKLQGIFVLFFAMMAVASALLILEGQFKNFNRTRRQPIFIVRLEPRPNFKKGKNQMKTNHLKPVRTFKKPSLHVFNGP